MVYVSDFCAEHVFYTRHPYVWPASLFLILCVFIPHIWAIDFYTKDKLQDIERSISYTWTFHSSWVLITIVAIYNTVISALGCYGAATQYPTPYILPIVSWLLLLIAIINNSDFGDREEHYYYKNCPYMYDKYTKTYKLMKYKDAKNKELLQEYREAIIYKNTRILRDQNGYEKITAIIHKLLAGFTFTIVVVCAVFIIVGENEYNQPGNNKTLVLAVFSTGCVSYLSMVLHLIIRSATCVSLSDKYFPSYAWNGVVSFFERMFTLCFLLIIMGTPKAP